MRRFTHGNTDGMLHRGAPVNPTANGREEWVRTYTKSKQHTVMQCSFSFQMFFFSIYLTINFTEMGIGLIFFIYNNN